MVPDSVEIVLLKLATPHPPMDQETSRRIRVSLGIGQHIPDQKEKGLALRLGVKVVSFFDCACSSRSGCSL